MASDEKGSNDGEPGAARGRQPRAARHRDRVRGCSRGRASSSGQGRDVIHLEIGEPDFATPAHVVEAGMRRDAGRADPLLPLGRASGAPRGRRRVPARSRGVDGRPDRRAGRERRKAVPLLHDPRDLRARRRGGLPRPGLPDLRVGDLLRRRDAGAAAAARGARLRLRPGRAEQRSRRGRSSSSSTRRTTRPAASSRPSDLSRPRGCSREHGRLGALGRDLLAACSTRASSRAIASSRACSSGRCSSTASRRRTR